MSNGYWRKIRSFAARDKGDDRDHRTDHRHRVRIVSCSCTRSRCPVLSRTIVPQFAVTISVAMLISASTRWSRVVRATAAGGAGGCGWGTHIDNVRDS